MQKNKETGLNNDLDLDYSTIDDAIRLTKELLTHLSHLSEYKHPLDVRRGRKEVVNVVLQKDQSKTVKAGSKTYFFDINRTKEGKLYLVITESRFKGEGEERERSSIFLFQEYAQKFASAVSEMVNMLE